MEEIGESNIHRPASQQHQDQRHVYEPIHKHQGLAGRLVLTPSNAGSSTTVQTPLSTQCKPISFRRNVFVFGHPPNAVLC